MKKIQKNEDILPMLSILDDFLIGNKSKNEFGMNITMVHGFLYSMVSSPCTIMPSDWFFVIFGGIPQFRSIEQQKSVYMAAFALYAHIENRLASRSKTGLFLWVSDGKMTDFNEASDNLLVDFCAGYVKGYFLDPILKSSFVDIPDLSLAFFLSVIKLGAEDNTHIQNIDDKMRITLQCLLVENYLNWLEVRRLNLPKTYFHPSYYKGVVEEERHVQ